MRLWRYAVLWYLGGMVYTGMELLWRGWSHGSMFVAGGVCFLLIGHLGEMAQPLPISLAAILAYDFLNVHLFGLPKRRHFWV